MYSKSSSFWAEIITIVRYQCCYCCCHVVTGSDLPAESCSAAVECSISQRLGGLYSIDDLNDEVVKSGVCICSGLTSCLVLICCTLSTHRVICNTDFKSSHSCMVCCIRYFINTELSVTLILKLCIYDWSAVC